MCEFKIKSYGVAELACMYFPEIGKKSASNQFRNWIIINKNLHEELVSAGLLQYQKILTPKQVSILIDYLGVP